MNFKQNVNGRAVVGLMCLTLLWAVAVLGEPVARAGEYSTGVVRSSAQHQAHLDDSPADAKCSTDQLPIDVSLSLTNEPAPGGEVRFRMTIVAATDIEVLAISLRPTGNASELTPGPTRLDDLRFGQSFVINGSFRLGGPGISTAEIMLQLVQPDPCGDIPRQSVGYRVIALDDGERVFTGFGSELEVQMRRLATLVAEGTLTSEEAEAIARGLTTEPTVVVAGPTLDIAGDARAGGMTTLAGGFSWKDGTGGLQDARFIQIKAFTDGFFGLSEVASTTANATGQFTLSISNDDLDDAGETVTIRFFSSNYATTVRTPTSFLIFGGNTYIAEHVREVVPGTNQTGLSLAVAENTSDAARAFGIADAMVVGSDYGAAVAGARPAQLPCNFPRSDGGTASFYSGNQMTITTLSATFWDVLLHEYGHYLADLYSLDNNPGGPHAVNGDSIASLGKPNGARLAWGEGLATYFAIAAQQVTGAGGLGVPNVGDLDYNSNSGGGGSWRVGYESENVAPGEGCEHRTTLVLYDIADPVNESEETALGHAATWNLIRASGRDTLSDLWNAFISGQSNQEKARRGKLFEQNLVSPVPTAPNDGEQSSDMPLAFSWDKNTLNDFRLQFFTDNFATVRFTSEWLGDVGTWTPSQSEWDMIRMTPGAIRWVVQGRNTVSPQTGDYWSGARRLRGTGFAFIIDDTGSMGEEIGGVRSALLNFINSIDPATNDIPFQLTTFKDNVSVRAATTDLNVIRSQVSGLSASGGDDCPEQSIGAVNSGTAGSSRGGTVFLATDADPRGGSNLDAAIAQLRARGARVNVLLSGTCFGSLAEGDGVSSQNGGTPGFGGDGGWDEHGESATDSEPSKRADLSGLARASSDRGIGFTGAIDAYSKLASETGGTFVYIPEVNFGQAGRTRYVNVATNILLASIGPRIVAVQPSALPAGTTSFVTVRSQNTSFGPTSVPFLGDGVVTRSFEVIDAVTILVEAEVAADATPGTRSVRVTTTLAGGGSEVADGTGLLMVTSPLASPALVSVSPSEVVQGESATLIFSAVNTAFVQDLTLIDPVSGMTIDRVTVESPTRLKAEVTVSPSAFVGFRFVSVTTAGTAVFPQTSDLLLVRSAPLDVARLVGIEPNDAPRGLSVDVRIPVSNLPIQGRNVTVALSGTGVLVDRVVACDDVITARLNIDRAALPGARDVIVVVDGQIVSLLGAFTVLGVPGDLDGDLDVDLDDLAILLGAYGSDASDTNFVLDADYNGDGVIGLADFSIWFGFYTAANAS